MSFNLGVVIGQSGTIADLDRKVATLRRAVTERDTEILRLHRKVQDQELSICLLEAENEGLLAQRKAYEDQHPDSPLLSDGAQVFRMGSRLGQAKTRARIVFERAFDRKALELGISKPTDYRDN